MSRVKIENDRLVITMQGIRRLLAFKYEISTALDNVIGVTVGLKWKELPQLLDKIFGTNSSFYYGGIFAQNGGKVFYDLRKNEDAIVITLKNEKYKRLIIGVDNPDSTVKYIEKALR